MGLSLGEVRGGVMGREAWKCGIEILRDACSNLLGCLPLGCLGVGLYFLCTRGMFQIPGVCVR